MATTHQVVTRFIVFLDLDNASFIISEVLRGQKERLQIRLENYELALSTTRIELSLLDTP